MIEFFLSMIPPTVTQQEHKVAVNNRKTVFYEPGDLKAARQKFMDYLGRYVPDAPMIGALRLTTKWIWPLPKNQINRLKSTGVNDLAIYKTTRPDTDNMIKMLKDCMTRCRFWKDDAQVASEITEKFNGMHPGIYIRIEELKS
jgi:Holliday junction resolvase RusA-like endonuclease